MKYKTSTHDKQTANRIRKSIFSACFNGGGGHIASSLSMVEIIYSVFAHNKTDLIGNSLDFKKDRFLLSSCQGALALYSVMLELGEITDSELKNFLSLKSNLTMFPTKELAYSDMTSGSLGHALSLAIGMSLFHKSKGETYRNIYVVMGDGELNEGSNWEAIMAVSHFGLSNICLVVNNNGVQIDGANSDVMNISPLSEKFSSFGWNVNDVDGHSIDELQKTITNFTNKNSNKPTVLLAKTIKGNGVSFTVNEPSWHYKVPTEIEHQLAIKELS